MSVHRRKFRKRQKNTDRCCVDERELRWRWRWWITLLQRQVSLNPRWSVLSLAQSIDSILQQQTKSLTPVLMMEKWNTLNYKVFDDSAFGRVGGLMSDSPRPPGAVAASLWFRRRNISEFTYLLIKLWKTQSYIMSEHSWCLYLWYKRQIITLAIYMMQTQ